MSSDSPQSPLPTMIFHRPSGRLTLLGRLRMLAAMRRGRDVVTYEWDGLKRTVIKDWVD